MRRCMVLALVLAGCGAAPEEVAETPPTPAITCPEGTRFDGQNCVWRWYVAEVQCPRGARWVADHCEARQVRCPPGARWDGVACLAPLLPSPRAEAAPRWSEPPLLAPTDGIQDPFESRTEARPLPPASDGVIDPFARTDARPHPIGADDLIDPWSLREMR